MKHQNAIKYGILSGVVIICYHLGFYFADKELILAPWFFFSIYVLHVPFMLASGLMERTLRGGLLEFKSALKPIFITFLIGMVFYYLIYYGLFNFDSELTDLQMVLDAQRLEDYYAKKLVDEDRYNLMKEALANSDNSVTIWSILSGMPFRILGGFILGLLIAMIIRR